MQDRSSRVKFSSLKKLYDICYHISRVQFSSTKIKFGRPSQSERVSDNIWLRASVGLPLAAGRWWPPTTQWLFALLACCFLYGRGAVFTISFTIFIVATPVNPGILSEWYVIVTHTIYQNRAGNSSQVAHGIQGCRVEGLSSLCACASSRWNPLSITVPGLSKTSTPRRASSLCMFYEVISALLRSLPDPLINSKPVSLTQRQHQHPSRDRHIYSCRTHLI